MVGWRGQGRAGQGRGGEGRGGESGIKKNHRQD